MPDLLDPGSFLPSVRPTPIFRRASRSEVVTNAHWIKPGEYPQLRGLADFFLFHADDADATAGLTVDVTPPRHPGGDPMRRGPAAAAALSTALQDAITPTRADLPERKKPVVRVGSTRAIGQAVRVPAPAGVTRP